MRKQKETNSNTGKIKCKRKSKIIYKNNIKNKKKKYKIIRKM